jgi:hypothetical protein
MTSFLYMFTKYHGLEYFVSKHMLVDGCKKYYNIPWLCHDIQIPWYSNTLLTDRPSGTVQFCTKRCYCSNSSCPWGIAQKKQYLREPVLAGEHGAQRVGSPGQVEQVAVEDAKSDVRGAALYGPFGLNKIMGMM